jgi:hypothetical protein
LADTAFVSGAILMLEHSVYIPLTCKLPFFPHGPSVCKRILMPVLPHTGGFKQGVAPLPVHMGGCRHGVAVLPMLLHTGGCKQGVAALPVLSRVCAVCGRKGLVGDKEQVSDVIGG